MSISICIRVFSVVLFAVCLNLQSWISASIQKNDSNSSVDINVIGLSIENDLPPDSSKLFFFADFQPQVEIGPGNGNAYVKLLNLENHTGGFRWNKGATTTCATISVIPSIEKGQRIFWSSWVSASSGAAIQKKKNDSNSSIDINVIGLSIENDLPSGSSKLFFFADFQPQVEIGPGNGNAYVKLLNLENHTGGFRWNKVIGLPVAPLSVETHTPGPCTYVTERSQFILSTNKSRLSGDRANKTVRFRFCYEPRGNMIVRLRFCYEQRGNRTVQLRFCYEPKQRKPRPIGPFRVIGPFDLDLLTETTNLGEVAMVRRGHDKGTAMVK
ncbi:hypothetical protein V8G54_031776 [Vigna mungo]|uniref:Uncharacterized protein n=1 Tax=Vigna mungo TaxID=3915 RepID=A0AAQ3REU4_VIGMU